MKSADSEIIKDSVSEKYRESPAVFEKEPALAELIDMIRNLPKAEPSEHFEQRMRDALSRQGAELRRGKSAEKMNEKTGRSLFCASFFVLIVGFAVTFGIFNIFGEFQRMPLWIQLQPFMIFWVAVFLGIACLHYKGYFVGKNKIWFTVYSILYVTIIGINGLICIENAISLLTLAGAVSYICTGLIPAAWIEQTNRENIQ